MNPENITGSAKLLHTIVFTVLQEFIRISALAILAIHLYGYPEGDGSTSLGEVSPVDDPSFFEVWLIGLGWAVAEVCASIAQGYELLSAYEDMFAPRNPLADVETQSAIDLVNQYRDIEEEIPDADDVALVMGGVGIKDTGNDIDDALLDLDVALTRLVNAKARDDLEAVYGVPFIVSYILQYTKQCLAKFCPGHPSVHSHPSQSRFLPTLDRAHSYVISGIRLHVHAHTNHTSSNAYIAFLADIRRCHCCTCLPGCLAHTTCVALYWRPCCFLHCMLSGSGRILCWNWVLGWFIIVLKQMSVTLVFSVCIAIVQHSDCSKKYIHILISSLIMTIVH